MPAKRVIKIVALGALCVGLLYRLFPLVTGAPYLAEFFITEDGYLMLTVARNMALGLGMSVSEGTIQTNGVQPMMTFVFAWGYVAAAGDKMLGLYVIHGIMAAWAVAGFFLVRAFASRIMTGLGEPADWGWLVAALWFLGPLMTRHTMNGLETGGYVALVVLLLLQFHRVLTLGADASVAAQLWLGAVAGLAFMMRNDAVFLIIPVFALWAGDSLLRQRFGYFAMLRRIAPAGLVTLAIAAPWLVNNQLRFGSIVPVSGTAQSFGAPLGGNLTLLPAKLFETMFPMLPIPGAFETSPVIIAIGSLASAAILGFFLFRLARHAPTPLILTVVAYLAFAVALTTYYGVYFGAPHFLARYFAPLSPLLLTAGLVALLWLARRLGAAWLPSAVACVSLCVSGALLLRPLVPRFEGHMHFQVVEWVAANVDAATWVGAVQTGTLGYWHDRTFNLDGKVNPEALAMRREVGTVLPYVVESEIDVIADWVGVAGWATQEIGGFSAAFELIVEDAEANLAVLRRVVGN
ncbi:MAG: hypothetical protein AAF865_10990 [Pseudomonadota bacterium]